MATIDKRNTVENLQTGGSDVGLAVWLDETEAQQIYDAAATEGWYVFGTFEGGTIGYDIESEEDEDEAGQLTGKTIIDSEQFVLNNTIKESDDATQELIDDILTQSFHKYRYPLPFGEDGEGNALHQVYGIERGKITPGFELQTGNGERRQRDIELVASKKEDTPAFVRKTVDLNDQTNWPAELEPFKDPVDPA